MRKTIIVPEREFWDELTESFITVPETVLVLEHSLSSISKWEAIWHKPFLSTNDKTLEETTSYVQCMTVNDVDPSVYLALTQQNIDDVSEYITDPMTATWFSKTPKGGNKKIHTSELLYYYMVAFHIPFECEHWHLNRLLTLIRVCDEESSVPNKKQKRGSLSKRYAEMNYKRQKAKASKG